MTTTMLPQRPPLTSIEKVILNKLVESLSATESQFCCGGVIRLPVGQKLSLLYEVRDKDQACSLELPPSNSDATEKLLNTCVPSSHGRGKETVYDESYRLARELKEDTFALTTPILNESGVLASIAALTSPRNSCDGITARLCKLNAYATGGFFKPHRDTPKSDRHIGTLVVALPVPYRGGVLSVSHEGKQVMFDWGGGFYEPQEQVALPWAFLFSDVEHEVLPVTSGTRVTIAYDIFAVKEDSSPAPLAIDGASLPIYIKLKDALSNKDFLPHGGRLAVALSHAYPVEMEKYSSGFEGHLKGSDAAMHRALAALGVPIEIRAVFSVPEIGIDIPVFTEHQGVLDEEFGPAHTEEHSLAERRVLYTSKLFRFYEEWDQPDWTEVELISKFCRGQVEPDLIWARKPTKDTFSKSGYYITEDIALECLRVATALVLDIPAAGESARALLGSKALPRS